MNPPTALGLTCPRCKKTFRRSHNRHTCDCGYALTTYELVGLLWSVGSPIPNRPVQPLSFDDLAEEAGAVVAREMERIARRLHAEPLPLRGPGSLEMALEGMTLVQKHEGGSR